MSGRAARPYRDCVVRVLRARTLLACAAALVVAGCATTSGGSDATPTASPSSTTSDASASPTSTNPYGTLAIDPAGPNDPVLTVDGGSSGTLSLTLVQLEALGTTTVTIDEPFVKRRETFTGVPLATILAKAGIPGGAKINTHALNDYNYANLASAFTGSNAIIATQRDAERIPLDQGGPIRIVFPDGTPLSGVLDAWNWSLNSITATTGSGA